MNHHDVSMRMKRLYTAEATATGGRDDGRARSAGGEVDLRMVVPGSGAEGTNPEELFALGYAACFNNAVLTVARRRRVDPGAVRVTARVHLGRGEDGRYGLAVDLETILPGLAPADAEDVVREADERCPYSNATRGNIAVEHLVRGGVAE
jgi:lipoyl-dependent peroxiredoxin